MTSFRSKLICSRCGIIYRRYCWKNRGIYYWACKRKEKLYGGTCKSENVKDEIIRKAFVIAWNAVVKERDKKMATWENMKKDGNPLQKMRARQMIEITAQGPLTKEVPELTRAVLERIIIHDKKQFTVCFLDGTVKEVCVTE